MKKCILAITVLALFGFPLRLTAQGTAFTYQGQLMANGVAANGTYDLAFTLYTNSTAGSALVGPVTNSATVVSNGLFTTLVDFGPGVFAGGSNWLELAVSTNGANSFTTLAPRQQVTPAPYALMAASAATVSGPVNASQLSGSIPASIIAGPLTAAQLPAGVVTNLAGVALLNGGNTFNGNQIIADGTMGIGTTTPGYNLDVTGNLRVRNPVGQFTYDGYPNYLGTVLLATFTGASNKAPQLRFTGAPGNSYMDIGQNTNGDFVVQGNDVDRLVVQVGGNVGIGTSTPQALLQVNGPIRMGAESTSEAPNRSGLIVRRINSTSDAANQIIAYCGPNIQLMRDGTPGGLVLNILTGPGTLTIAGFGINNQGTTVNVYTTYDYFGKGTHQIFTDSQNIGYFRLTFGDAANASDSTTVEMMRRIPYIYDGNVSMIGTLTSTYNQ